MRHRAVEPQRVARLEAMDLAVEVDLEPAADQVRHHLAGRHLGLLRPAAHRRPTTGARAARGRSAAARGTPPGACGITAPSPARHARSRGPQRADRHAERLRDPLDGAHARPREPALELAQERMREPGLAAEHRLLE
jgi:hypothetical protein